MCFGICAEFFPYPSCCFYAHWTTIASQEKGIEIEGGRQRKRETEESPGPVDSRQAHRFGDRCGAYFRWRCRCSFLIYPPLSGGGHLCKRAIFELSSSSSTSQSAERKANTTLCSRKVFSSRRSLFLPPLLHLFFLSSIPPLPLLPRLRPFLLSLPPWFVVPELSLTHRNGRNPTCTLTTLSKVTILMVADGAEGCPDGDGSCSPYP